MDTVLIFALGFVLNLGCVCGSDIYPSIAWVPQNPLFAADGDTCGPGPRQLKVHLQSKVNFICPNTATVLKKSSVSIQTANMYENLWMLYNKTAFDRCDASLDPERRLILQCKTPSMLSYFPVLFAQHTAEPNGLKFEGGRSYYFIATSDGTESHINDTSGGHCQDSSNNVYMKIEVYVCKKSNATYRDCTCANGVGELKCPNGALVTSSLSTAKATPSATPISASSEEISTTGPIQPSTSALTTEDACVQTVITKTVSPEAISTMAKAVFCADVCNSTVSSTVTSTKIKPTTETSVQTVSSTVTSTKTVRASEVLSTEIAPSTFISSKATPFETTTTKTKTVRASEVLSTEIAPSTFISSKATPFETTATKTKTVRASEVLSTEIAPSTFISSKAMPFETTSTKNVFYAIIFTKTVFSAVTPTETCDLARCSSLSAQSVTVSSKSSDEENRSGLSRQEKQSGGQNRADNEEKWMTVAICFVALFFLEIIIGTIIYINYRKKICYRYSNRVAPHEEITAHEMNPAGYGVNNPVYRNDDVS